jgi:hypothetical protein
MNPGARWRAGLGVALALLLATAASVALTLAGCGGSTGSGATETPASQPAAASPSAALSTAVETVTTSARTVPRLEAPGVVDEHLRWLRAAVAACSASVLVLTRVAVLPACGSPDAAGSQRSASGAPESPGASVDALSGERKWCDGDGRVSDCR